MRAHEDLRPTLYRRFGKRLVDIVCAILLLIGAAPVMSVLAILVRCKLGAPVIFRQLRVGIGGGTFEFLKFRSMTDELDPQGRLLSDERRLTAFGGWLRRSSLDELPQLWSVLRGDMSLVGPRPLLVQYLALFTPEQARRHLVRPGITGYAQVNGRNSLSWDEKFRYDVFYVYNYDFLFDCRIMVQTIISIFKRRGISSADHVTMPLFNPNTPSNERNTDK
jgi:sugar transferase EpsL